MKQAWILIALFPVFLTGCLDDRKNPVSETQPGEVQRWLKKVETEAMQRCAAFWQDPDKASPKDLKDCDPEKKRIAKALNQGGFSNQEVLPEDLELKAVWIAYHTRLAERIERLKDAARRNEKRKQLLKKLPHPGKK